MSVERIRRVGVFIDYWYAYTSARQLYGGPGAPPAWFGNVSPATLARVLVKRPPAAARRSERVLHAVTVFVRHFDPEVHHGQLERVRRWQADGATVVVGPSREEGAGFWQSALNVGLAAAVADELGRNVCDTAVVFAGDGALLPLLGLESAGEETPSPRIELATWVGRDGAVPTTLVTAPRVWCHRLGETTFKQVVDQRRLGRPAGQAPAAQPKPGTPPTAMAAAMVAAGLGQADAPPAEPMPTPDPPRDQDRDEPRGVRRITHRLFGRGA
ncbi:MAG TPA: hypothetical protein VGQ42_01270 [Candidatus Dormibacteraeota bacterium]|nr:hypothetical protein [Candidatus Dormibacteraeota bacterium]